MEALVLRLIAVLQPHCLAQISLNPLNHTNLKLCLENSKLYSHFEDQPSDGFMEIIRFCFDSHTKYMNTLCG